MLCASGFVDDVMFSHNEANTDRLGVCGVASYSPKHARWHR